MVIAGNNLPGMSDFHKELINRFFNSKSYFVFSFINELKNQEELLENPENVAVIGLVVDEIINSQDKIETLFGLTRIPGFDVFYHTLMEKVEYLRVTHLTTDQMMEVVKNLGISLSATFVSMMKQPDSRKQLLAYVGLQKTEPPSPSLVNESTLEKTGGVEEESAEDVSSQSSAEKVASSNLSELLQRAEKVSDVPDPWDFFYDDVAKKLNEIEKLLEQFKARKHDRSLLRKVKIAFQELREWAMIQGNEGIETISMRTLSVLNIVLRTFGFPLEKVIPDVEESVKALREINRLGWAGENLDIVPVVLHNLEKLQKEVETMATSVTTPDSGAEIADIQENPVTDIQEMSWKESDFNPDEEFKSSSVEKFLEEAPADEKNDELSAHFSLTESESENVLQKEKVIFEEENSSQILAENHTEDSMPSDVSEREESVKGIAEEQAPDGEDSEIPLLDKSDFSVSEMEKLYDEMFPQEEAESEGAYLPSEMSDAIEDESPETEDETSVSDDSLGDILDDTLLLSEVDESQLPEESTTEGKDAISLPGEDDEELLEVIDELSEELPEKPKKTKKDEAVGKSDRYHVNLLESENDQAAKNTIDSEPKSQEKYSGQSSLIVRGGEDFVEEAEMYFQFAKRAFTLLKENMNNHRSFEDVELACYSLKILSRKLGYEYVTRIVERIETLFKKILSGELLPNKEHISYISDVIIELENRGRQNQLSDDEIPPWASKVLSTLSSFEENFLQKGRDKKRDYHDSEVDESKDPLGFLMYDDSGKYFKQLLDE